MDTCSPREQGGGLQCWVMGVGRRGLGLWAQDRAWEAVWGEYVFLFQPPPTRIVSYNHRGGHGVPRTRPPESCPVAFTCLAAQSQKLCSLGAQPGAAQRLACRSVVGGTKTLGITYNHLTLQVRLEEVLAGRDDERQDQDSNPDLWAVAGSFTVASVLHSRSLVPAP